MKRQLHGACSFSGFMRVEFSGEISLTAGFPKGFSITIKRTFFRSLLVSLNLMACWLIKAVIASFYPSWLWTTWDQHVIVADWMMIIIIIIYTSQVNIRCELENVLGTFSTLKHVGCAVLIQCCNFMICQIQDVQFQIKNHNWCSMTRSLPKSGTYYFSLQMMVCHGSILSVQTVFSASEGKTCPDGLCQELGLGDFGLVNNLLAY